MTLWWNKNKWFVNVKKSLKFLNRDGNLKKGKIFFLKNIDIISEKSENLSSYLKKS